jgi:hypothetical protein
MLWYEDRNQHKTTDEGSDFRIVILPEQGITRAATCIICRRVLSVWGIVGGNRAMAFSFKEVGCSRECQDKLFSIGIDMCLIRRRIFAQKSSISKISG